MGNLLLDFPRFSGHLPRQTTPAFELHQAERSQCGVAATPVVESFDIGEDRTRGFQPCVKPPQIDGFSLQTRKEALDDGVAPTIPRANHSILHALCGEWLLIGQRGLLGLNPYNSTIRTRLAEGFYRLTLCCNFRATRARLRMILRPPQPRLVSFGSYIETDFDPINSPSQIQTTRPGGTFFLDISTTPSANYSLIELMMDSSTIIEKENVSRHILRCLTRPDQYAPSPSIMTRIVCIRIFRSRRSERFFT